MSDREEPKHELDDLHPLEEHEDFHDLEPIHAEPPASEPEPTPAPSPADTGGEGQPSAEAAPTGGDRERRTAREAPSGPRELERAPLLLRKASLVLLAGSVVPWGDAAVADLSTGRLWGGTIAEKLICFLAVWVFHQSHVAKHGGKAHPLVASLAKGSAIVPMALSGVLAIVGLLPLVTGEWSLFTTYSEKAFLLLGGFTFVHIYDYEHGGKFNPIFPLLFLAPAIGGFFAIFRVIPDGGPGIAALLLGTLPVTAAGAMAMYTMYVALKQAKIEGDRKRQAQIEARKAARAARRSGGGSGGSGGSGSGVGGARARRR